MVSYSRSALNSTLYMGVMSGTSVDAIDVVLVDFNDPKQPKLIDTCQVPWPAALQKQLVACSPEATLSVRNYLHLETQVTEYFAKAINQARAQAQCETSEIQAVGCHGQTIAHCPELQTSAQLCLGGHLAVMTGMTVINDFRAKDLALGGQGAPLVPAFHAWLWDKPKTQRLVVNLGGLANVTVLDGSGYACLGFDTGPANTLLDAWFRRHHDTGYFDENGDFARRGTPLPDLLQRLLNHPYLQQPAPKSADRQTFGLDWLEHLLNGQEAQPQDVQATLVEFTVMSLAREVRRIAPSVDILLCGGGAKNIYVLERLKTVLPECSLTTTQSLGIDPQWVEAMAFAWFAYMHVTQQPVHLSAVTGAQRNAVLGVCHLNM